MAIPTGIEAMLFSVVSAVGAGGGSGGVGTEGASFLQETKPHKKTIKKKGATAFFLLPADAKKVILLIRESFTRFG